MSTRQDVRGVVNTAVYAGGVANKVTQGLIDGRNKVNMDKYTVIVSDLATASTIKLGSALPVGAKVLFIILSSSVAQTSLTASVGDANSATRYANANTGLQTANSAVVLDGQGYIIGTSTTTDDTQILLTTGGADGQAGVIYAQIHYATN